MNYNIFNLTVKAIKQLSPELRFTLSAAKDENGLIVNAVDWESFIVGEECVGVYVPTREQVEAKVDELALLYDATEYQRKRAKEYPSIGDQLDKLYHDIKSGNLETGTWIAAIEAVKEKYPKPE